MINEEDESKRQKKGIFENVEVLLNLFQRLLPLPALRLTSQTFTCDQRERFSLFPRYLSTIQLQNVFIGNPD